MKENTKKFSVKTLGCKLNQYESAIITQQFLQSGWEQVRFGHRADVVLINTCTVTDRSDKKCRNYIRQGAKSSTGGSVYVTGCLVDRASEEIISMNEVRAVFSNRDKDGLVNAVLSDFHERTDTRLEGKYLVASGARSRAFLKIQDGCDGVCSYCIIPSVRGVPVSRNFDEVIENVRLLERDGVREVVLTGITIGKYSSGGKDLADLVKSMLAVSDQMRFRITSIEPLHINNGIISLFKDPRICAHIHLPLQSGCDRVLREMNRQYTVSDYIQIVENLREVRPEIAIGTDIIVGFPGETDDDFSVTMNTLTAADIPYIHQFTFSPRSGTPAADRKDFCTDCSVFKRSEILRRFSDAQRIKYQEKYMGIEMEGIIEKDSSGCWATTGNYIRIKIDSDAELIPEQGETAAVRMTLISDVPHGMIVS